MPVINPSSYTAPAFLSSGHLQTIIPTLFRRVRGVSYVRERITTPDDDFLDLDWSRIGARRLALVSHGLEGDSRRHYMLGMVRALNRGGWDALAWNYRGCSGEPNRKVRSYHSGATDDLQTVISHATGQSVYQEIVLVGFSLGGNITLKYLGEKGERIDSRIKKAVAISVPCDLAGSAEQLARPSNFLYMRRFLRMFRRKIRAKMELLPGRIDDAGFERIKNFRQFDDRYTAPIHGFKNAEDYWQQCSSRFYLAAIRIPALLLNAENDPFLTAECFPYQEAREHSCLFLETPRSGGHVGFMQLNSDGWYYSEKRTVDFLKNQPLVNPTL